jgi:hypothetical protein
MIELNLQDMGVHIPSGCRVQLVWAKWQDQPYCRIEVSTGRRSVKTTSIEVALNTLHCFEGESQRIIQDHLRRALAAHYSQPYWS